MRPDTDGGNAFWDPIYGGGSGWGQAGAAFNRLLDCVLAIRNVEFSDEAAVGQIRDAARNQRDVLHLFAEEFLGRDWYDDPLLTHVADLVREADSGTAVSPLDTATAEIVAEERRLLKLSPEEAFNELATRQPALHDWARRARDPQWRAEQDSNPPSDPAPPDISVGSMLRVTKPKPTLGRWLMRRVDKRVQRSMTRRLTDPKWVEFQRSVQAARSHEGSMYALAEELHRLVGPDAETDDPLIRTYVAQAAVAPYIWELTGIPKPSPPRR